MDLLEVGKIVNTHALKGEVKIAVWMDYPEDFEALEYVYVKTRAGETRLNIEGIKYQKNNLIVKFREITDIDEAARYKNSVLYAERGMIPMEDGAHFIADLIGLDVIDSEAGEKIGVVADVFNTGSNDIYDVRRDGKKNLLLPVIDDVVKEIDIENGRILVYMMEGLDDEV
ncbi:MAG: ribosome maturation factor RimM [Firmicutes bacterium]|nr:ribosome maturation factor RimM [Bacillota bacterium]